MGLTDKLDFKQYALIINYGNMRPGGIETTLYYLMYHSLQKQVQVYWITTNKHKRMAALKDLTQNKYFHIVVWEGIDRIIKIPRINIQERNKIVMISCNPIDYLLGEQLKKTYRNTDFRHFLVIGNYRGGTYFPDQWISIPLIRRITYSVVRKWIRLIDDNMALRAFSMKHLDAYEHYYNISIRNKKEKLLQRMLPTFDVNEEELRIKASNRCKEFRIFSCARFDFPHKGYLLGLIDKFEIINNQFPNTSLTIVGAGNGESALLEKIRSKEKKIQEKIEMLGALDYLEMIKHMRKSHLNIGLAGAAVDGASIAVPTIITRHYDYSCESYGLFSDNPDKTLGDDKGMDIIPFICRIICMDENEYIEECYRELTIFNNRSHYNQFYFFSSVCNSTEVFGKSDYWFSKFLFFIVTIKKKMNK